MGDLYFSRPDNYDLTQFKWGSVKTGLVSCLGKTNLCSMNLRGF